MEGEEVEWEWSRVEWTGMEGWGWSGTVTVGHVFWVWYIVDMGALCCIP